MAGMSGRAAERIGAAGASMLAFALPPRCPGCGTVTPGDHRFCLDCWQALDFLGEQACAQCGEPFELPQGVDVRCGACLADPPRFDSLRAAVSYGPIAAHVALRLKYARRPGLAKTISRQLDRLILPHVEARPLVAPVPLHRWRIWSRGYNQAALIARALATPHGLPLALDLIARGKATPSLKGLGPAARRKAVRGAFFIPDHWRAALNGREVLLIDDVYTTGATANACAAALKRAGAASVHLICWARVLRDQGEGPSVDI